MYVPVAAFGIWAPEDRGPRSLGITQRRVTDCYSVTSSQTDRTAPGSQSTGGGSVFGGPSREGVSGGTRSGFIEATTLSADGYGQRPPPAGAGGGFDCGLHRFALRPPPRPTARCCARRARLERPVLGATAPPCHRSSHPQVHPPAGECHCVSGRGTGLQDAASHGLNFRAHIDRATTVRRHRAHDLALQAHLVAHQRAGTH